MILRKILATKSSSNTHSQRGAFEYVSGLSERDPETFTYQETLEFLIMTKELSDFKLTLQETIEKTNQRVKYVGIVTIGLLALMVKSYIDMTERLLIPFLSELEARFGTKHFIQDWNAGGEQKRDLIKTINGEFEATAKQLSVDQVSFGNSQLPSSWTSFGVDITIGDEEVSLSAGISMNTMLREYLFYEMTTVFVAIISLVMLMIRNSSISRKLDELDSKRTIACKRVAGIPRGTKPYVYDDLSKYLELALNEINDGKVIALELKSLQSFSPDNSSIEPPSSEFATAGSATIEATHNEQSEANNVIFRMEDENRATKNNLSLSRKKKSNKTPNQGHTLPKLLTLAGCRDAFLKRMFSRLQCELPEHIHKLDCKKVPEYRWAHYLPNNGPLVLVSINKEEFQKAYNDPEKKRRAFNAMEKSFVRKQAEEGLHLIVLNGKKLIVLKTRSKERLLTGELSPTTFLKATDGNVLFLSMHRTNMTRLIHRKK